jgi:arginine-glutamic acid dipeptide repeat-containing protein
VTEDDNSEDDSDSREAQYRCSHCFTTNSKDWQPAGKDRQLLCWDCRAHLKKTNELPPLTAPAAISGTPPIGKFVGIWFFVEGKASLQRVPTPVRSE